MQFKNESVETLHETWLRISTIISESANLNKEGKRFFEDQIWLISNHIKAIESKSGQERDRHAYVALLNKLNNLHLFFKQSPQCVEALESMKRKLVLVLDDLNSNLNDAYLLGNDSWPIPDDISSREISPHLSNEDVKSLASTCKFFALNLTLRDLIKNSRIRPMFAVGGKHTLFLTEKGILYGFGSNESSQLGLKWSNSKQIPERLELLPPDEEPRQIACGYSHSLILGSRGNVYGFGKIFDELPHPKLLLGGKKAQQIASGSNHILILTTDGDVLTYGDNMYGQLGLDENPLNHLGLLSNPQNRFSNVERLTRLPQGEKPTQVFAGGNSSFIICESDNIYAFGNNAYGQLGINNRYHQPTPALLTLPDDKKAIHISCSGMHTGILCESRETFFFGLNQCGQLGLGYRGNNSMLLTPQLVKHEGKIVKQLALGHGHSLVLYEDGEIRACGNKALQVSLDDVEAEHNSRPNLTPLNFQPPGTPQKIFSGCYQNFIVYDGDTHYAFGRNEHYKLGLGYGLSDQIFPPTLIKALSGHEVQSTNSEAQSTNSEVQSTKTTCMVM